MKFIQDGSETCQLAFADLIEEAGDDQFAADLRANATEPFEDHNWSYECRHTGGVGVGVGIGGGVGGVGVGVVGGGIVVGVGVGVGGVGIGIGGGGVGVGVGVGGD